MLKKLIPDKTFLMHLGIVIASFAALILLFFFVYLPLITRHGQSTEVPDLTGIRTADLDKYLGNKGIKYVVVDSVFSPEKTPLTVLSQQPMPGSKVKSGRKVYLTITAGNPPKVKITQELSGKSLFEVKTLLQSYGLKVGNISYQQHFAENSVLRVYYKGAPLTTETEVIKGSKIDLVVARGLGEDVVQIPNLIGLSRTVAGNRLSNSGLSLGSVIVDENATGAPGTVIRQKPEFELGETIRVGEVVDVWVTPGGADVSIPTDPDQTD